MRTFIARALVVAFGLVATGAGAAQTGLTEDIGGDWNFRFTGDKGAMVLHLGVPDFGGFTADGAGFTTLFPAQMFAVEETTTQYLSFDSVRDIHGELSLQNTARNASLGRLTIAHGSYNARAGRVLLRGTMTMDATESAPAVTKKVSLIGTRLALPETSLTGRTFNGSLIGKRCRSSKYDIQVYDETATSTIGVIPTLKEGFPFFYLHAGGPARVDGVEVASRVDGLLVADARGKLFGRVDSSDFGSSLMKGSLSAELPTSKGVPALSVSFVSGQNRRAKLSGLLQ